MLSLAIECVDGISYTTMCIQVYFVFKRKQPMLMNHLGGMGLAWFMLSGYSGPCLWLPGVSHLWTATQEQRDWRRSSWEASSAATCHMGSVLTIRRYEPGPTWHDDVECVGGNGSVWWCGELPLKGLVLVFSWPSRKMSVMVERVDWVLWEKCTTSRECQTKYLAVSPVMDNYEQLDLKLFGRSPHPNFLIKYDGLKHGIFRSTWD